MANLIAKINPKRAASPKPNPRLLQRYQVITPTMDVPIDIQVYRASTIGRTQRYAVYADVYIRHGQISASGSGKAGAVLPVQYDQATAAVNMALNNAGVLLYDDRRRLFELPIEQAIAAICAALSIEVYRVIN